MAVDFRQKLRGAAMKTPYGNTEGIILDTQDKVKRTGYRSTQDQIRELMRAGVRTQAYREEQYATPTGINARLYGELDPVVGSEKLLDYQERIKAKLQAKKKAEEEEQIAAQEEAKKAKETPPSEGGVT